jgi:hypothetical protein
MSGLSKILAATMGLLMAASAQAQTLGTPRPIHAEGAVVRALTVPRPDMANSGSRSFSLVYRTDAIVGPGYDVVATQLADGAMAWRMDNPIAHCGSGMDEPQSASIRIHPSGNVVVLLDVFDERTKQCVLVLTGETGALSWARQFDLGSCGTVNARCKSSIAFGESGDLLLSVPTSQGGLLKRLTMSDGVEVWSRAPAVPNGSRFEALAMSDSVQGSFALSMLVRPSSAEPPSIVTRSYLEQSGDVQWSIETPYQGTDDSRIRAELRKRADGHVIEVLQGVVMPGDEFGLVRRLDGTGAERWRRNASQIGMLYLSDLISVEGSVVVNAGGGYGPSNVIVLDEINGSLRWSEASDGAWLKAVVVDDQVHVLRGAPDEAWLPTSGVLTRHAGNDGSVLSTETVTLHPGGTRARHAQLAAAGGDVVLTSINGSAIDGSPQPELHVMRLQPGAGTLWSSTLPMLGARPFLPNPHAMQSEHFELDADVRTRFAYVAGYEPDFVKDPTPALRKIDIESANVPWVWRPPYSHVGVAFLARSVDGGLIVGSSETAPSFALSKVDAPTGVTVWVTGELPGYIAGAASTSAEAVALSQRNVGGSGSYTTLSAFALATGQAVWSVDVAVASQGQANLQRLADDDLAFTSGHSTGGDWGLRLHKRSRVDGSALWEATLRNSGGSIPARILALAGGDALVVSGRDIWRVEGDSGTVLWQQDPGFELRSALVGDSGEIIVAGHAAVRLDPATGMMLWTTPLGAEGDSASSLAMTASTSLLVAGGSAGGWAAELDPSSGHVRWWVESSGSPSASETMGLPATGVFAGGPIFITESESGRVVFAGTAGRPETTLTLFTVDTAGGDRVFADGFDSLQGLGANGIDRRH